MLSEHNKSTSYNSIKVTWHKVTRGLGKMTEDILKPLPKLKHKHNFDMIKLRKAQNLHVYARYLKMSHSKTISRSILVPFAYQVASLPTEQLHQIIYAFAI